MAKNEELKKKVIKTGMRVAKRVALGACIIPVVGIAVGIGIDTAMVLVNTVNKKSC